MKRIMRKYILGLLLITSSSYVFSQDCKYKTNKIDDFTKSKILETKEDIFTISGLGFGFSTGYSLMKINDNRYIKLIVTSPSIFILKNGHEIMFKTEQENTIDLKFNETVFATGSYNSSLKSTLWKADILISIPEDLYQRFLNEKILKLRVYTGDGYVDDDISRKRSIRFKELLKCI